MSAHKIQTIKHIKKHQRNIDNFQRTSSGDTQVPVLIHMEVNS